MEGVAKERGSLPERTVINVMVCAKSDVQLCNQADAGTDPALKSNFAAGAAYCDVGLLWETQCDAGASYGLEG